MRTESHCVHRANDLGEADVVVAWLEEQGIPAFVKDEHAVATLHTPFLTAPKGIAVCVVDVRDADRAKELLAEHARELSTRRSFAAGGELVAATCEECGAESLFPASLRGTVQNCPVCRAHTDVPDA